MGLAEPEFRQVTVAYLHELYDEIAELRRLVTLQKRIIDVLRLRPRDDSPPLLPPDGDWTLDELEALPPRQQEVMLMRMSGQTQETIAADLGIAVRTVKNTEEFAARALKRRRARRGYY